MASLLSGFDEDKQRLSPHGNYRIPRSSGFGRLCFKNDCAKLQGKWGCWFWPSKMKVLSNNYHPDSIFGLFVGREMIIRNLSLTSRKKCIEKYNFEGDMMPFTWRVCAKIRGPPVFANFLPFCLQNNSTIHLQTKWKMLLQLFGEISQNVFNKCPHKVLPDSVYRPLPLFLH